MYRETCEALQATTPAELRIRPLTHLRRFVNGVEAMLGKVKENLYSQSFKSSLERVFQSVGLSPIISTTHPDGTFASYQGEGTPGKIRKQLIHQSPNETEEIWSLRDTQLIDGLLLKRKWVLFLFLNAALSSLRSEKRNFHNLGERWESMFPVRYRH